MLKDNIKPDFGWGAPFDSRELGGGPVECENPDFSDKYMHRMALVKVEHLGSKGDRDETGLKGWVVKRVCNGCGREFGPRFFRPQKTNS